MRKENENDLIVIYEGKLMDASIVKGLLINEGIPGFLRDEHINRSSLVLNSNFETVKVAIARKNLEKAQEIVDEFNQHKDNA